MYQPKAMQEHARQCYSRKLWNSWKKARLGTIKNDVGYYRKLASTRADANKAAELLTRAEREALSGDFVKARTLVIEAKELVDYRGDDETPRTAQSRHTPNCSPAAQERERRRLRVTRDRQSKLWATAAHEAGHALLCILSGVRIDHVTARYDGSGLCEIGSTPRRADAIRIAVAGAAAADHFGFRMSGLGGDHALLKRLGVNAHFQGAESEAHLALRKEVAGDIRQHRRFVQALADELYIHEGEPVSGGEILKLWESFI